jgi:hypothetical protein
MALHTRARKWLSYISKTSRKILTTNTKKTSNLLSVLQNTYDPKTLHTKAAGSEEEDDEQEDMAYIGLVANSAP